MTVLGLHNLTVSKGSKTRKRRVGRGNASGKGNQSGRGGKGQKARSGGKAGLVLFGVKNYLLRIPKSRGFKSLRVKTAEINLGTLNKFFKDGDIINPSALVKKGLISSSQFGVKVLGEGEFKKKFTVKAQAFSVSAKEAIIKAGGTIEILEKPEENNQLQNSKEPIKSSRQK